MPTQSFKFKSSLDKLDRLVGALSTPMTRHEIQLAMHMGKRTVNTYIAKLMEEGNKRVYIKDWKREQEGQKTHLRPVYAAGKKRDKKKPAPLTNAEINRRQYARIKANPEKYAIHLMKERHRMSMRNFKPRPDIAAAWLFGKAA